MTRETVLFKIYISIILILSIFISPPAFAENFWTGKGGELSAYELTSIAVDSENAGMIYVGSKGYLFKTSDDGESWKSIFDVPGANKSVNFIALHPADRETLYIATESGIFKSVDGGDAWRAMPLGAEKDNVFAIHIDCENPNILFAATAGDIFITQDAGKNWTRSSEGLSGINIRSIAQNYINREILYVSAESGLFKSIDGGRNWTKIFSEDSIMGDEGLENEYGEEDAPPAFPAWVSVDPFDPETVYLSTKNGIFKSNDSGNSWNGLPNIGLSSACIKNLAFPSYNRGFFFAVTRKGVFRFSEQENIWKELYGGPVSSEPSFIALSARQDALWLAAKNGIYRSEGDIYEIKNVTPYAAAKNILRNFSHEPSFREIQNAAIEYAEVHPEKIAKWRRAAKAKALLPQLSFSVDRDSDKNLHWDAGSNPDTWVIGPEDESTGWDVTCSWDLGDLIWNDDQTSIDVRSKLMVQLRDDILDEVTHLYFERRRLQVELLQNPPKDVNKLIESELRLQELTADIDAMTGGYLSSEIVKRNHS